MECEVTAIHRAVCYEEVGSIV